MMAEIVGEILGMLPQTVVGPGLAIVVWLGVRKMFRKSYETGNVIELGLRVKDGKQPGLSETWAHGTKTASPGSMRFVGQNGETASLQVVELRVAPTRTIGVDEMWDAAPLLPVIELMTPTATIEVILSHASIDFPADKLSAGQS